MGRKKYLPHVAGICVAMGFLGLLAVFSSVPGNGEDVAYVQTAAVAGEEDVVLRSLPAGCGKTVITCNVDWGEEMLPEILKICREKVVKLTFFVTGRWAEENPELLRQMYGEGHEIQSHGYSHSLCSQSSEEKVREEIQKTEDILDELLGVKPGVFAPPSGDYDAKTVALCREMGYVLSLWSADTIDWREGSTAQVITERILSKELDGGIILMHPKPETAKALPGLIDAIRERGLEPVPLIKSGRY